MPSIERGKGERLNPNYPWFRDMLILAGSVTLAGLLTAPIVNAAIQESNAEVDRDHVCKVGDFGIHDDSLLERVAHEQNCSGD